MIVYLFSNIFVKSKYFIILFVLSNILAYRLDLIVDYILFPLIGVDGYLGERVRNYFMRDEFWSSTVALGTIYRVTSFFIDIPKG